MELGLNTTSSCINKKVLTWSQQKPCMPFKRKSSFSRNSSIRYQRAIILQKKKKKKKKAVYNAKIKYSGTIFEF
ncbi:hypothetical protein HanRHA438_Chr10g0469771 [Helianthus annuus]|nr:hypothetical protein HanRHA438_Chr10g0469771 [Helianthus annuus]